MQLPAFLAFGEYMELINWQEEHVKWQKDGTKGSFICWLILCSLTKAEKELEAQVGQQLSRKKFFDDLSVATDKWTKLQVTLQVNGVELPVQQTIDEMENQLDFMVENKARKLVNENTSLAGLMKALDEANYNIQKELQKIGDCYAE